MWCRELTYETLAIDCAFTSLAYFSTEEYNKGGEHEETNHGQSLTNMKNGETSSIYLYHKNHSMLSVIQAY